MYVGLGHASSIYFLFADPRTRAYGYYGRATNGIYLDNLGCRGSESRLIDCSHSPIGVHNCYHGEDVRIRCQRKTMPGPLLYLIHLGLVRRINTKIIASCISTYMYYIWSVS